MSPAVRYVAHAASGGQIPVVAGYVAIDADGRAVLHGALAESELVVHGWRPEADDERRAHALANAAETALAEHGYQRSAADLDWVAQPDPAGRWSTTSGAELERIA